MEKEHVELIRGISNDLNYLKGRFDTAIPKMEETSKEIRTMLSDHETRIKNTEVSQENIKTKVAIAGGTAGIFVTIITNWFIKRIF